MALARCSYRLNIHWKSHWQTLLQRQGFCWVASDVDGTYAAIIDTHPQSERDSCKVLRFMAHQLDRRFLRKLLSRVHVPPGDIVCPLSAIMRSIARRKQASKATLAPKTSAPSQQEWLRARARLWLKRFDSVAEILENDTVAGLIFAFLAVVLLLLSLG